MLDLTRGVWQTFGRIMFKYPQATKFPSNPFAKNDMHQKSTPPDRSGD